MNIQISFTGYVDLKIRSTAVATQVVVLLKVLWRYSDATVTKGWEATAHAAAAEYPHSSLYGTLIVVAAVALRNMSTT